jgi:hypothetical protein
MPESVSSNHFSHDQQVMDALDYLRFHMTQTFEEIRVNFPEIDNVVWSGSWFDCAAMNVDPEYTSWLADAIVETGFIYWEEGEPWSVITHD